MRIVVLVKIVPKQTTLPMSSDYTVDRNVATSSINPNDYHAIEEALRIKEKNGGEVIVLSLGNISCKTVLKDVYALGVDRIILLSDSIFKGSDTFVTSNILAEAINKIGNVDMVVAGKKSSDGSTSQVPNEVAALLGWNSANNIIACETFQNKVQYVERYEKYDIKRQYDLPIILSVSSEINVPRLPSIEGLLKATKKEVLIWDNCDLEISKEYCGINGSKTQVAGVENVTYSLQREMKVITEKKQIVESYRELRKSNVDRGVNCENKIEVINDLLDKKILVFCEVNDGKISNESLYVVKKAALVAKKNDSSVVTISSKLENKKEQLKELSKCGVKINYEIEIDNIYLCDKGEICRDISQIAAGVEPELILFASTQLGMNIAPYFAAMNQSGLTAECIDVDYVDDKYLQKRPAFGGRLIANIFTKNSKYSVATIKPYVEQMDTTYIGEIENKVICSNVSKKQGEIINNNQKYEIDQSIVIGCGNGIHRQEILKLVKEICMKKQYGFCATRELVDKGWVDTNRQVGLTGQVISPDIYIAIGISGAYEHIVGIEQSNVIISVNTNATEPISKVSDVIYEIDSEEFINILAMEEMI